MIASLLVCLFLDGVFVGSAFSIGRVESHSVTGTQVADGPSAERLVTKPLNIIRGEERWRVRFEEIKKFITVEGHSKPNVTSADPEVRLLGIWARNQRMQYTYLQSPEKEHLSFLTEERISLLNSIGFVWRLQSSSWEQKYLELLGFRERFGHANVPSSWRENKALGSWCANQRQKYRKAKGGKLDTKSGRALTDEQISKLNDIEFEWYPELIGMQTWWQRYESLRRFKERFGHCHVPQDWKEDIDLGRWVRHQKRACREYALCVEIEKRVEGVMVSGLSAERLEALRELDFCWLPDPRKGYQEPPDDIFGASKNNGGRTRPSRENTS